MTLKVYSIRDQKGENYNSPFYKQTHGEAERDFRTVVNDDKSMLYKYPEDYDLYYLGEFDTSSGLMKPVDTPLHIIKAVNCVKKTQ